jgi:hypothetical protein
MAFNGSKAAAAALAKPGAGGMSLSARAMMVAKNEGNTARVSAQARASPPDEEAWADARAQDDDQQDDDEEEGGGGIFNFELDGERGGGPADDDVSDARTPRVPCCVAPTAQPPLFLTANLRTRPREG